jgi:hypothetical protein
MHSKTLRLASPLAAFALLLFVQAGSKADTFHRVAVNGAFHLTTAAATGLNVNSYSTYRSATGVTTPGGTIVLTNDKLSIHVGVASVVCDTTTILGTAYKHATVTTTAFTYNGDAAHLVVEVTAYTRYGEAGFQVVRNSDGATLTASWPNGFYTQMPLEWGGVTIQ